MNSYYYCLLVALVAFTDISLVLCQGQPPKDFKVGQPQFSLQGAGGGNSRKNWNAGFQAGVGTKVWESKNRKHSVDVGATYGQGFVRHQGTTYKSKPNYGLGLTYRFPG